MQCMLGTVLLATLQTDYYLSRYTLNGAIISAIKCAYTHKINKYIE